MLMVSLEALDIEQANALLEESVRSFVAERLPADQVADAAFERVRLGHDRLVVQFRALRDRIGSQRRVSVPTVGDALGAVDVALSGTPV